MQGISRKVAAGRGHVDPDKVLGEKTQPHLAAFAVEGEILTVLFKRTDVTHHGIV